MTIKDTAFFTIQFDSSFEWDLSGFEPELLVKQLLFDEESLRLNGKVEAAPKAAMGFGLKKKSVDSNSNGNNELIFDLPVEALRIELVNQFRESYQSQANREVFTHVLCIGSLKKNRKTYSVLNIPVEIVVDAALELPFRLRWNHDIPFFSSDLLEVLAESGFQIPTIPEVIHDLSIPNLIHDFTYKFGADSVVDFKPIVTIRKVKTLYNSNDEEINNEQNEPVTELLSSINHTEKLPSEALSTYYTIAKQDIKSGSFAITESAQKPFTKNLAQSLSLSKLVLITSKSSAYLNDLHASFKNTFGVLNLAEKKKPDHLISTLIQLFEESVKKTEETSQPHDATEAFERLASYGDALNLKSESGWSPAELMILMIKFAPTDFDFTFSESDLEQLNTGILNQRKQLLKQIYKLESQIQIHPIWDKAEPTIPLEELSVELKAASSKILQLRKNIADLREQTQALLGIPIPTEEDDILAFLDKVEFLKNCPQFERHQIDQNWHPIPSFIYDAFNLIEKVKAEIKLIEPYFHIEIIYEPIDILLPEIEALMHSPKRYVDWNYKQHAKRLIGYAKQSTQKFDPGYISRLRDVLKVKKVLQDLNEKGRLVAKYFGAYWQGMETDVNFLKEQMVWFQAFSKLKLEYINENIDQLKKLILRKDTDRAVRKIKELHGFLSQFRELENQLNKNIGLSEGSVITYLEESELDEVVFFEELEAGMSSLKQKAMLQRLKDSEQAKRLEPFLKFAKKQKLSFDNALLVFEKNLLKAYLDKLENERPVLKNMEISDIKNLIEFISSFYDELIQHGEDVYLDALIEQKRQPQVRKKLKELLQNLNALNNSNRIPHSESILNLMKDGISSSSKIILCNPNQLESLLKVHSAVVISDFELDTNKLSTTFSSNWIHLQVKSNTNEHFPALVSKEIVKKENQIKGEAQSEFMITILSKSAERTSTWIFETEKAEYAFWHKLTHNSVDFNSLHANLNDRVFKFSTLTEERLQQDKGVYSASHVIIDYSFIDPKVNPFALKKSSPKQLQEVAAKALTLSNSVEIISNDAEKSEDIKRKVQVIDESTKWSISDESLLQKQLSKATFLALNPVFSNSVNPLNGWVLTADKRMGFIWSDYSTNETSLNTLLIDALSHNAAIYNPVRKLYKQSDSLLFDVLAFIKGEQTKPTRKSTPNADVSNSKQSIANQVIQVHNPPNETSSPVIIVQNKDVFNDPQIPSEFSFSSIQSSAKTVKPKLNKLPKIKPFIPHEVSILGEPDQFFTTTGRSLKKVILEIVRKESPIHWHRLTRLVVNSWQQERLSENSLIITKKILTELIEKNELFIKDGVLYDNPDFKFTIRSRIDLVDFNADEIPFVELEMALFLVLDQYYPISLNDLIKAASYLLGFEESTASLDSVLKRALIKIGMEQIVAVSENGFQLTRPVLL